MVNLRLGNWSTPAVPGYSPSIGDTETVTLFGDAYDTIIMPDGKEWLKTNLRRADYGMIVPGDTESDVLAYGRGYLPSEFLAWTDLPDGWHVPTENEWSALFTAIGATYLTADGGRWSPAGTLLKEAGTAHWDYTTIPGEDNFGFAVTGSGYWIGPPYYPNWERKSHAALASTTIVGSKLINFQFISGESHLALVQSARRVQDSLTPYVPMRYGVRLVRDIVPVPPTPGLSSYHDIILTDSRAVLESSLAQRIDCRLRTILGEWFLDRGMGLDYFGTIFQKAPDLAEVKRLLTRLILQVPGAVRVLSLELEFDRSTRQLRVIFSVAGTNTPANGSTVVPL